MGVRSAQVVNSTLHSHQMQSRESPLEHVDSNFRWRTAHAAHDMDSGFHKLARDNRIDAAFILMSCIIYRHAFLKPSRFKCILRGRVALLFICPRCALMGARKLSEKEVAHVDSLAKAGKSPATILAKLKSDRAKKGVA